MAVVEIRGLVKRYGAVTALRGVDLTVEEGEIFGLLGPNGAGKTTTVEILAGLRSRDAGQVSVLGLDPAIDRRRLSWLLALQPQRFEFLEDTTVAEIVAAYASLYGERRSGRIEQLLERVGLADRRRARFQHLSGGQRQRLNICLALIGNPRLIVLDEPTTGL
ncbi:MAG: ABC transporter ATP-binding protein, partial [Gemmataceae bacterium]|nr:ABC transporter ATP-binding protein [Gemmataceae bacterium]